VSVDAEAGYSASVEGLTRTVELLAAAGAAGISIEDYDPKRGILDADEAVARVTAIVDAANEAGITVTARAENHLYGIDDLTDTIARLHAYRGAGAHVVYAPFLSALTDITRVVAEVDAPVNVLLLRNGPNVAELRNAGVRRLSTGGALAFAAYGALATGARELIEEGTSTYTSLALSSADTTRAFGEN
jgi:2-methylisocitrate lyase-like PEP mutase family enzyme